MNRIRNLFQGPGRIEILQDEPVQKISRRDSISKDSTTSTVTITDTSQKNVSATQGCTPHSVSPRQFQINVSHRNMKKITRQSEFMTCTAGPSTLQGNMVQDSQSSECDTLLTIQNESQGLLQSTRIDPVLSSAGFGVNWQSLGTTNSKIIQTNYTSQPPSRTTFAYTSDLNTSYQASKVC